MCKCRTRIQVRSVKAVDKLCRTQHLQLCVNRAGCFVRQLPIMGERDLLNLILNLILGERDLQWQCAAFGSPRRRGARLAHELPHRLLFGRVPRTTERRLPRSLVSKARVFAFCGLPPRFVGTPMVLCNSKGRAGLGRADALGHISYARPSHVTSSTI